MLKFLAAVAALLVPQVALAQSAPEPPPVEIMVLGVWHMDNPGRDLNNASIDPVTTPEKQAELAAVAGALARFRPTAVAVESVAPDQSNMLDAGWPAFDAARLLADPDERVQIGYRLAARAGVDRVYAVDEKERDGQPSYFPYADLMAWAQANGRIADLQALGAAPRGFLAEMEARQRTHTVGQMLAEINAPEHPMVAGGNGLYYRFLQFGAGDVVPGAELNGRWYTRNAKIFAKLMQVARPGDRIVLVFGAGHAAWLRHFARTVPGFKLVEPGDYLGRR